MQTDMFIVEDDAIFDQPNCPTGGDNNFSKNIAPKLLPGCYSHI
jgi:hypothetical protein